MLIDLKTLIILNGSLGLISAIMLTINWVMNRKIKATKDWCLALWCWTISLVLLLFRGSWSPMFTIVLSNGFIILGSFYMLSGMALYLKRSPISLWITSSVTMVLMYCFYHYTLIEINAYIRVMLLVSFSAIIKFYALYYLIASKNKLKEVEILMSIGFIVHGLIFAYHFILGAWGPENFIETQLQSTMTFLLIEVFLFMIWFTVSATMLTNNVLQTNLKRLAYYDSLTGILNRRSAIKKSENAAIKCLGSKLSILVLDLDRFKHINDKYGHAAGDNVLKQFSKMVSNILNKNAIFGRIGGEEFLITLPNTSLEQAQSIAENICHSARIDQVKNEGGFISYSVSIGCAMVNIDENMALSQLILQADKSMYLAKEKGRDRVETFANINALDIELFE